AALIGSVLIDPDGAETCADILPRHFYLETHRVMWQAIADLRDKGEPADYITLTDLLMQRGKLEECGGEGAISSLAKHVPTGASARYYGNIIKRAATQRAVIDLGADWPAAALTAGADALAT